MLPLSDTKRAGSFIFWTKLLIIANIWIFFLEITASDPEAFIAQFALIPALIDLNNPSSLTSFFTSQFLHAGFVHILSNMWFLHIFGDNVEERVGYVFFPIIYLASGATGGLFQYITDPTGSIPMLGASGAIAGVLGAYFALFPHNQIRTLVPVFGFPAIINLPASFMLIYWFFTQLFSGTASVLADTGATGGVAFFAHIGGFGFGYLAGIMFKR